MEEFVFCKGGGCTAKLGPAILNRVLEQLPKEGRDERLLVGYDSRDDAAVYQVSADLAYVATLDFFPPMVDDPYDFGQIAAANAMSDVFAMGGRVTTALNIVCFPQDADLNILGKILMGGAEKVAEAGASLAGGHSIDDSGVKYGLSVNGLVDPRRVYTNTGGREGDALVLTKRLGVGLICTAARVGQVPAGALEEAVESMKTLNMRAALACAGFDIHACTDVTGFGLLGHLHEMMHGELCCNVDAGKVPVFKAALACADEFLFTAAAQRNRNYLEKDVFFTDEVSFATQEVLFDPQTSGGLLIALSPDEAPELVEKLRLAGCPAQQFGVIRKKEGHEITVYGNA